MMKPWESKEELRKDLMYLIMIVDTVYPDFEEKNQLGHLKLWFRHMAEKAAITMNENERKHLTNKK